MSFGRVTLVLAVASLVACSKDKRTTTPREIPAPSVQVGSCGEPGKDGVMSANPKVDHADRDLDGDNIVETIVTDRAMCTSDGNCYWNVFKAPQPDSASTCARYLGTFSGAALEPLTSAGESNMHDVRGYWNLHGGRLLLQSYRFVRGGYELTEALLCKRAADDRLECSDDDSRD
ncbi:MAG TPA: hypothetical protein VGM90_08365 [Kofleriaceae bacterium]|jgi:hypothetical protein